MVPTRVDPRTIMPVITDSERLTASGVVMDFAGLRALDDVSLSLGRDEIVGLIGPNGSGKTTLVNVLSGALTPTAGTVTIDGHETTRSEEHTSELQSRGHLVCRLLLEKKKNTNQYNKSST